MHQMEPPSLPASEIVSKEYFRIFSLEVARRIISGQARPHCDKDAYQSVDGLFLLTSMERMDLLALMGISSREPFWQSPSVPDQLVPINVGRFRRRRMARHEALPLLAKGLYAARIEGINRQ